ncbi:DGQHR domain-containing protein [Aliarcobacter cryaerophilus]|uniref:DGQHR domain-containing protein n=1 Tax=Aliarcobacter cryaerophilus TaxID=28198 RepID=UPI0021B2205D|nr:DGQHR domain-containing protein [Aliarcobacter cryaerophilus]MCT7526748.1 DGQHR domain-containing protein [Aliarcobacter cryaerophilus]MCT7541446.1 DGQHR domain-containing protein [Aliarcobacter cryaerophilus]
MKETTTINVLKLRQSKWDIYIGKINAKDLYRMSRADIMSINETGKGYDGVQRELDKSRVSSIEDYLESLDATFPNSIILNIDKKYVIDRNDNMLEIEVTPNTFSIIDGQHRLAGFENGKIDSFDLNVSIFIGLTKTQQQRIFNTINKEHTKVNKSQSFYTEINDEILTPRKFIAEISSLFATDVTSPWYKKIKLLGKKDELSEEGIISLDAFSSPLISLIYNDKYFFKIRNFLMENNNNLELLNSSSLEKHKSIFWELYIKQDIKTMYKIYYNYFNAIKKTLPNDWGNSSSILTKTTGYNAFLRLFKDLSILGLDKGDLSEEYFFSKLNVLNNMDGRFNSNEFASSGDQSSAKLYEIIKKKVITLFNF